MAITAEMAGLGFISSGIQAISGAKQRRDAKNALEAIQRQELNNVAEGLTVSTLGSDLQREESARLASSQQSALQGAGVRGLIGGLGRVEAGNQQINRQTAADLDMQQKQIDQIRAQDEANIRSMQEQREVADISALSSQYNAGNAMLWQGIGGMAQSGMSAFGAMNKGIGSEGDKLGDSGFNTGNTNTPTSLNFKTTPNSINNNISTNNVSNPYSWIFNQSPTSNSFGQIPSNMGSFMQSQNYSPTRTN